MNSTYHRGHLKERLYSEGLKARFCELCGQGEEWRGGLMSLILDHVNGIANDNRLENLRIVCPNCAATLDTHCGRKLRLDREPRSCARCSAPFVPKYESHRYCSRACGMRRAPGSRARPRPEARKVERPPLDELRRRILAEGYCAVARELGVSDVAIRGWFRSAGEEPPRRGRGAPTRVASEP